MRMIETKWGGVTVEAGDDEVFFDGGVTDHTTGNMLNFYLISNEALEQLVEQGSQILIERGLRKIVQA